MRAHSSPPPAVASYWNGEPARPVHIAGVVLATGRLLTNRVRRRIHLDGRPVREHAERSAAPAPGHRPRRSPARPPERSATRRQSHSSVRSTLTSTSRSSRRPSDRSDSSTPRQRSAVRENPPSTELICCGQQLAPQAPERELGLVVGQAERQLLRLESPPAAGTVSPSPGSSAAVNR